MSRNIAEGTPDKRGMPPLWSSLGARSSRPAHAASRAVPASWAEIRPSVPNSCALVAAAAALERARPGSVASGFVPAQGARPAAVRLHRFELPDDATQPRLVARLEPLAATRARVPADWYTAIEDGILQAFEGVALHRGGNPAQFLEILSGERYQVVAAATPESVFARAQVAAEEPVVAGSALRTRPEVVPEHAYVVLGAEAGPDGRWIDLADPTHGTRLRLRPEEVAESFTTLALPKRRVGTPRSGRAPPPSPYSPVDHFVR